MTYLEICKLVRQECGIQSDNTPTSVLNQHGILKRIIDWVQQADGIIQTKYSDWDFLWKQFTGSTTIVSSDSILKPNDYGMWDKSAFVMNKGLASAVPLDHVPYKDWRKYSGLRENQEPYQITVLPNGNLALDSPADGVYPIDGVYWVAPVPLAADTDVPPYAARFHRCLVARSKMFFYEDQEAWDNFNTAEKEWLDELDKLESFAGPGQQFRKESEPEQLVVRPV